MKNTTMTLPSAYRENVLTLMVCSPTVLFAYWDFSQNLKKTLVAGGGFHLRLVEVDRQTVERMMPVYEPDSAGEQNIYFTVLPGGKYKCELGFYAGEKVFIPVLVSQTVVTPPLEPAFYSLEEVASAREDLRPIFQVEPLGYSGTLQKK